MHCKRDTCARLPEKLVRFFPFCMIMLGPAAAQWAVVEGAPAPRLIDRPRPRPQRGIDREGTHPGCSSVQLCLLVLLKAGLAQKYAAAPEPQACHRAALAAAVRGFLAGRPPTTIQALVSATCARAEQKFNKHMRLRRAALTCGSLLICALRLPGLGIAQCNSVDNTMKIANRWAAVGQRARCNF